MNYGSCAYGSAAYGGVAGGIVRASNDIFGNIDTQTSPVNNVFGTVS